MCFYQPEHTCMLTRASYHFILLGFLAPKWSLQKVSVSIVRNIFDVFSPSEIACGEVVVVVVVFCNCGVLGLKFV